MSSRVVTPALAAKLEAERRLKEGISGHRTGLPKKLLDMFAPMDPPAQLTPLKKPKVKLPYMGIAQYVGEFAEPTDPEYEPPPAEGAPSSPRLFANPELNTQARVESDSIYERRLRASKDKKEKAESQVDENLKEWDPSKDPNAVGDPFKTLFVARISYEATERKLRREFEEFGPIKSIRLVHERNSGKSRGYAFIEFEHKNDMKLAYKNADGKKVEGKRVVVDVERGRTVPSWRARRFGGGKGGESREAKVSKKKPAIPALLAATVKEPAPEAVVPRGGGEDEKEKEREKDRERERDRDREKEKDREKDRDREREREGREGRERDRAKDLDLSRVPPPGSSGRRESDRDRDANGRADRDGDRRDRDRDRDRDRKRDRSDRDPGERDRRDDSHRSSKRHKEDKDRSRRRERDLL